MGRNAQATEPQSVYTDDMNHIPWAVIVIFAGSVNVCAGSFDELKAAAPADLESAAAPTPAAAPVSAANNDGETLHGRRLSGFEIFSTHYLCDSSDDRDLAFCKSDWRAEWAADTEKAVNEYVAQYNVVHPQAILVVSYQDNDPEHKYPFWSINEQCAVRAEALRGLFGLNRGVSYTIDDIVEVDVYDDATVKTRELIGTGITCSSSLEVGGCDHRPSKIEFSIDRSSDGTLKSISYMRHAYYRTLFGAPAELSGGPLYAACGIQNF